MDGTENGASIESEMLICNLHEKLYYKMAHGDVGIC
jgi:hypothetical protein